MTKIIIIYILLILMLFIYNILCVDTFGNSSSYTDKQNYAFINKQYKRIINSSKDGIDLTFDHYNNQHNDTDTQRIINLYNQKRTTYDLNKSSDADNYYNIQDDNVKSNTVASTPNNSFDILYKNIWLYLMCIMIFTIIFISIWIIKKKK